MTQHKSSEERAWANALGKRLRSLRGTISQEDFAKAFGVTRSALANYETGRSRAPMQLLEKIAESRGLDICELAAGPDPADYEDELKALVGDGTKLTSDEWAFIRLLRLVRPETVSAVVQDILSHFEHNSPALQLADPQTVAVDLARLYTIAKDPKRYDRGVSGANVVQLAKALAGLKKD